jgi:hypothetical protein
VNAAAPVVALHRAPAEVEARVREACLRAGAEVLASDALEARKPELLIAHLPKRGRRIPAEVLEIASRFDASLPILLACDETLVHPATTLRIGGVTLVEHAATERLYSQIRIVLAAARAGADGLPREAPFEQAGPDWWLATIAGAPQTHIARDESGSVTLLLPFGAVADPVSLLADAHEVIASAPDMVSSLVSCIGGNAGFVHLSLETRSWVIYWPPSKGGLRLFSSHRLPHLSNLSCTDAPRIFRSGVAPGEIVVATSRPLDADDYDVLAGLTDGGPVTVDRLRALSNPPAGFVVEVR